MQVSRSGMPKDGAERDHRPCDLLLRLETLRIPADDVPGFEHLGCTITPGTLFSGG